jgi:hypothetical protein
MTVHPPESLRRKHRQIDHQNAARERRRQLVAELLNRMKRGASLHHWNRPHRTIWILSDGTFVTPEAAVDLMNSGKIAGVGDSLIGPELSQTFRFITTEENDDR